MIIPTEPIGSIPRPPELIAAITSSDVEQASLDPLYDEAVRDTIKRFEETTLEAADFIPVDRLGTTDDRGFAPFCDDTSTTRDTAFAKIRARVVGTAMASEVIGGRS